MAELGDFLVSSDSSAPRVEVEMLDFSFIEQCQDERLLRAILDTLQSGREGHYPELCKAAEDKLMSVLPEKERKRILRLKHHTTPDQVNEAERELDQWQADVINIDYRLRSAIPSSSSKKLPPVRGQKVEKLDVPRESRSQTQAKTQNTAKTKKSDRLSGYDFPAWEKFSVEDALADLDEEEQDAEKDKQDACLEKRRQAEEAVRKRMERHADNLKALRTEMKISEMTYVQRTIRADREKQKGNECFRAGENEEAFEYYTRSLALDDTVAAVYSNRALVGLRLSKLDTAEDDCSRALYLDPGYTKARSRRGIARFKGGKYDLAIQDFECALETDSENKELQKLLCKAKEKYLEVEGKEYGSGEKKAGMNEAKSNDHVLKVVTVASSEELLCPLTSGGVNFVMKQDCVVLKSALESFTRVVIEDSGSDSDSNAGRNEDFLGPSSNGEGFTRIQITEDSDSEEDSICVVPEGDSGDYVRIPIAESDSDSDSEEEETSRAANVPPSSEDLKTEANSAMQSGNIEKAISLYTQSILIDPDSPVAMASLGNRSLAFLKLKMYDKVLEDTNAVLSHDPQNIKALYRRAMSYEATSNFEEAIDDLDEILKIQPGNVLAFEARSRVAQAAVGQSKATKKLEKNAEEDAIKKSVGLKNLGNELFKQGKYESAVKYYSEAIRLDSKNALLYNNRAQAYLKTFQFIKAEADASYVITSGDRDSLLKAHYRRALARKGINSAESLQGALGDLNYILSSDPENKVADSEKQKIEALIRSKNETVKGIKSVNKDVVANDSKNVDESGLIERSTKKKTTIVTDRSVQDASSKVEAQVPPGSKPVPAARVKTKSAKDISVKNPHVPQVPPKTVYEFERIWRGLKNRPDLFARYLQCFKKSTYRKVLTETCSPDLFTSMLVSVRDHMLPITGCVNSGIAVLEGFASMQKYDMALSLLPAQDIECMKSCVDYIAVHVGQEKAVALQNKLKMD